MAKNIEAWLKEARKARGTHQSMGVADDIFDVAINMAEAVKADIEELEHSIRRDLGYRLDKLALTKQFYDSAPQSPDTKEPPIAERHPDNSIPNHLPNTDYPDTSQSRTNNNGRTSKEIRPRSSKDIIA